MNYSVIIVAAGSGTRMKLGYNKVYAKLEDNRTILRTAMDLFMEDKDCKQIIVVTSADSFYQNWQEYWPGKVLVVKGGKTRQESVSHGLQAVKEEYVFVHDGARPYLEKKDLEAIKKAVKKYGAAVLSVPPKDTIKKVEDGFVKKTYRRENLFIAQTPQAFRFSILYSCMMQAIENHFEGTDDCLLVEKYADVQIKVVEGSYRNLKITTEEDLKR
ncbi:MAG: 2-C-methyl-D-erythritol 4-phosphate cytidylyltransferase [Solobacterium sp.]|nr:2-C-methyl-D-erythritol 4-phosphate cytidylyltransferase [Solobacterium sp.]